jgi:antitoxin FitA
MPMGQRLKAIFDGAFESQEEADEFHRILESERKNDLGRPLPDFQ